MKINPLAHVGGRKALKSAAKLFRKSNTTEKTISDTALNSSAKPPSIAPAETSEPTLHRKKPSPTLNGSPIKKHRTLSRGFTTSIKFSSENSSVYDPRSIFYQPPSKRVSAIWSRPVQPIPDPLNRPGLPSINDCTPDEWKVIAEKNSELMEDPLDEDNPYDLSTVSDDANGNTVDLDPENPKTKPNYDRIHTGIRWLNPDPAGISRGPNWFRTFAQNQQQIRFVYTKTDPSLEQYHELADEYIDSLLLTLEGLEDRDDGIEVEYSIKKNKSNVLTLKYPPHGTYVLNKQPPNKQIWLSSPISGPRRFDYREVLTDSFEGKRVSVGKWVCTERDGEQVGLSQLLEQELNYPLAVHGEGMIYDAAKKMWKKKVESLFGRR